jgi:predicted neutral ceramidase superfamily lipid hydrolase
MESVRELQKKYCSRAMATAIVMALILIVAGLKPAGKGLVLGTIFSILNFIIMGETLGLRIGKTQGKVYLLSFGSIIFRYALLAVPLISAIKFEQFNIIAAICGIFMIQLMILTDPLWNFISSHSGKQA